MRRPSPQPIVCEITPNKGKALAGQEIKRIMRSIRLALLVLTFLFAMASVPAFSKDKFHLVHQEADRLEYDDKSKIMHLAGHVKLWQEKTYLECDHAVYNLKSQEAQAEGSLKMSNPEGNITGDRLQIFYNEKRAVVEGHVTLLYTLSERTKEKKDKLLSREPITVTSDNLEYDWGKKIATASGKVVLIQKERKAYGNHAVFEEIPEQLTMDGDVKLLRPPKDELSCDHLVYNLKTDHATAEGHVVGSFLVKEEKQAAAPIPAPSPAPARKQ